MTCQYIWTAWSSVPDLFVIHVEQELVALDMVCVGFGSWLVSVESSLVLGAMQVEVFA